MEFFKVGGCVRDALMGRASKDIDFAVVIDLPPFSEIDPFACMRNGLRMRGFEIFQESPQFLTIRARAPKGFVFGNETLESSTFDFVLARKDGTAGRRPEFVIPGTLHDDLARRDFTMNAIAQDDRGILIDPFGGQFDIQTRTIRTVGSAFDRFNEDRLRILRAIRFAVTLGFHVSLDTDAAIRFFVREGSVFNGVSVERVREELNKAFRADSVRTIELLTEFEMLDMVFRDGLRLEATSKQ